MKLRINYEDDDLWCLESKNRIEIGERYVEVNDPEDGLKTYKLDYAPVDDEEDLPYIA